MRFTKRRLAAGLRPDPLEKLYRFHRPLAVIRGGEGGKGKKRVGSIKDGRKARERRTQWGRREGKGKEEMERGGTKQRGEIT